MRAFFDLRGALCALTACLLLVGCASTDGMLDDDDDLTWGPPIEDDYEAVITRARSALMRDYPLGLDPDRSNEKEGDLWAIWAFHKSVMYRETKRKRARVKVENLGEGKVRVGVAVMEQLNDNIDDPSDIDKAKWVRKHRLPDDETRLRETIERQWSRFEASTTWKEKHRGEKRKTLRPDLVDRTSDVAMGYDKKNTITTQPKVAGGGEYGGKQTDYGSHLRKKKPEEKEDDDG
ncbi:MAG: hypothetical protein ACYTGZ_00735 [Planctomycetota bacterium]